LLARVTIVVSDLRAHDLPLVLKLLSLKVVVLH
jgi:hypothetical protein